jgi:hypothetical protein
MFCYSMLTETIITLTGDDTELANSDGNYLEVYYA